LRAPKRRKRLNRSIGNAPPEVDLAKVVAQVSYIGSPEHKDRPSFAGWPRPRSDASICDETVSRETATEWLRAAMNKGVFGELWEGRFPRYVWYKDGVTVYEARLVNQETGEYKGYPLEVVEWPPGISGLYE
jgi:hypothetical protein